MRKVLWPDCLESRHRLEMEQIELSGGAVFVAEGRQDELIGFAEVSIRQDHVPGTTSSPVPYLEGWYVDERFRGMGVGRNLLIFVEIWCRARLFNEIASDTGVDSAGSLAAHLRLGFVEVEKSIHLLKTF